MPLRLEDLWSATRETAKVTRIVPKRCEDGSGGGGKGVGGEYEPQAQRESRSARGGAGLCYVLYAQ